MYAAFHVDRNQFEVRECEVPKIGQDEALVRVRACGFCGSERHSAARDPSSPWIFGHEFSGVVAEIEGESPFRKGDAVIVDPAMRCGECCYCLQGRDHLCRSIGTIGYQATGAFAEWVKVPLGNLHRKPDHLSFEEAALADPLAVALHTVDLSAEVEGKNAVIFGAGTIGILLAQVLALRKACHIMLVDIDEYHLEVAKTLGPFLTLHSETEADHLDKLPWEVDFSFELAGGEAPTFEKAMEITRKGGTVFCIAQRPKHQPINYSALLFGERRLQGVYGQTTRNFAQAIGLMSEGEIETKRLITDRFRLTDFQKAFERFLEANSIKVVVEP